MILLGRLCRVLIWLVILIAGFSLISLAISSDEAYRLNAIANFYNLLGRIFGHALYIRILPGIGLVLVALLAAVPWIVPPGKPTVKAFSTASGPIEITKKAIEDFVRQLCMTIPGVREVLGVQVYEGNSGVDKISMTINIREGFPVPKVSVECQDKLAVELGTTLGIEKVNHIRVKINSVNLSKSSSASSKTNPRMILLRSDSLSDPNSTTRTFAIRIRKNCKTLLASFLVHRRLFLRNYKFEGRSHFSVN